MSSKCIFAVYGDLSYDDLGYLQVYDGTRWVYISDEDWSDENAKV